MLITNTSSSVAATTGSEPIANIPKAPAVSPASTARPASRPQDTVTTSATSAKPAPAPAKQPVVSAAALAAASVSQTESVAASYTISVGGKSYSGSVEESGGVYTASYGGIPSSNATGSTPQAAENNLSILLDELV